MTPRNGFMSRRRAAEHGFTSLRRSAEHGFTLIEVMVALFIFGLLAAAGVSLLSFSVRTQVAANARLADVAGERRFAALLSADLAQAAPRIVRDLAGNPVRAFEGADGHQHGLLMAYVRGGRSNPDDAARAGLQRVDIVLNDDRLERRAYPMIDGSDPATIIVLADHVETVAARYRSEREWRARWDATRLDALPRAVELTVKRAGQPALLTAFLVGTGNP